jgi:hypothetical protein
MPDQVRDQVARDGVTAALARIDKHEAVCAERAADQARSAADLKEGVSAIRRGVEGLYNRLWQIAGTIIIILLGALGTLLVKAFLH